MSAHACDTPGLQAFLTSLLAFKRQQVILLFTTWDAEGEGRLETRHLVPLLQTVFPPATGEEEVVSLHSVRRAYRSVIGSRWSTSHSSAGVTLNQVHAIVDELADSSNAHHHSSAAEADPCPAAPPTASAHWSPTESTPLTLFTSGEEYKQGGGDGSCSPASVPNGFYILRGTLQRIYCEFMRNCKGGDDQELGVAELQAASRQLTGRAWTREECCCVRHVLLQGCAAEEAGTSFDSFIRALASTVPA